MYATRKDSAKSLRMTITNAGASDARPDQATLRGAGALVCGVNALVDLQLVMYIRTGDVATCRSRSLLCTAAVIVGLLLSGCASSSSSGGSSGGAAPSPSGGQTGAYTPASGTTQSGVLFPVYTNRTAGYSFDYPGGWRVAEKGSGVRIARFGDAVTVVVRPRQQAPSSKGYQKQLVAMLQQHDDKLMSKIVRPASVITVGRDKVTMAVIEQVRPTGPGADAPKDTLVVNRYLFWNDGKLALLSMSSVKGVDNNDAWNLMANSFKWN